MTRRARRASEGASLARLARRVTMLSNRARRYRTEWLLVDTPTTNKPVSPRPIPDRAKVLTVSELNHQVKALVEDGFRTVWGSGEVSNVKRHASGHMHLCLKENEA